MGNVLVQESSIQAIADAIRRKSGGSETYKPREMAAAIQAIPTGGGNSTLISKTITQNGTFDPADDNANGYSEVTVSVPSGAHILKWDSNYFMTEENGLICTLDGREYRKYNSDPALVAYLYATSNSATGPILVSETADGAKYNPQGYSTVSPNLTVEYYGKTYYISTMGYAMAGNCISTGGFAVKLTGSYASPTIDTDHTAALDLLDLANQTKFTQNGTYTVPSGFDGFGELAVDVPLPTLSPLSVVSNGTYTPASGNGYSSVTVAVPSGGVQLIGNWDFTQSLTDTINGITLTLGSATTRSSEGVVANGSSAGIEIPAVCRRYPGNYEFELKEAIPYVDNDNLRLFMWYTRSGSEIGVYWFNSQNQWGFSDGSVDEVGFGAGNRSFFSNSIVRLSIGMDQRLRIYKNGELCYTTTGIVPVQNNTLFIGGGNAKSLYPMTVKNLKIW